MISKSEGPIQFPVLSCFPYKVQSDIEKSNGTLADAQIRFQDLNVQRIEILPFRAIALINIITKEK